MPVQIMQAASVDNDVAMRSVASIDNNNEVDEDPDGGFPYNQTAKAVVLSRQASSSVGSSDLAEFDQHELAGEGKSQ